MSAVETEFQLIAQIPRPDDQGGPVIVGRTREDRWALLTRREGKLVTLSPPVDLPSAVDLAERTAMGDSRVVTTSATTRVLACAVLAIWLTLNAKPGSASEKGVG